MTDRPRAKGKLTGTQAGTVNELLHHLGIGPHQPWLAASSREREPYPAAHLGASLAALADQANNGIYAGLDGDDVLAGWPRAAAVLEVGRILIADVNLIAELLSLEAEGMEREPAYVPPEQAGPEIERLTALADQLRQLDARMTQMGLHSPTAPVAPAAWLTRAHADPEEEVQAP